MFSRFFLPTLLSALILSSLVKASLPQVGEDLEEKASPLMMERPSKPDPQEKGSITKSDRYSVENGNVDSTQSRSLEILKDQTIQENDPQNNETMMELESTTPNQEGLDQHQKPSVPLLIEGQQPQINFQGKRIQPGAIKPRVFHYSQDGGFQEQNNVTGESEVTDHFNLKKPAEETTCKPNGTWKKSPDMKFLGIETQSALRLFIRGTKNIRDDKLSEKITEYEKELNSLDSNSEQAGIIQELIKLHFKAREYHEKSIKHLIPDDKVSFLNRKEEALDRKATLKVCSVLQILEDINNNPNKVERLIEEIEKDYQGFIRSQETSGKIEDLISETPPAPIPPLLINAQQAIRESLDHYRALIQLKSASAELIKPPFEEIDQEAQAAIEASKINIIRTAALAQERYLSAKNKLYRFTQENNNFVPMLQDDWINHVDRSLFEVALEAQREEPRQEVIDRFLHSAELFSKL